MALQMLKDWVQGKGYAAENGGVPADATAPVAKPAAAAPALEPRVAATNPVQTVPSAGSGYLVQVSSEKNETDAQASYRALQSKFPSVLGSRSPVIKRADLGDKGVYYRAMVGPFVTPEEASQFCGKLKTAGGHASSKGINGCFLDPHEQPRCQGIQKVGHCSLTKTHPPIIQQEPKHMCVGR